MKNIDRQFSDRLKYLQWFGSNITEHVKNVYYIYLGLIKKKA